MHTRKQVYDPQLEKHDKLENSRIKLIKESVLKKVKEVDQKRER